MIYRKKYMKTQMFMWDWKDEVPLIEMLEYQKKNPELNLYEIVNLGGTFTHYIFAPDYKVAKKEAESILDGLRLTKKNVLKIL